MTCSEFIEAFSEYYDGTGDPEFLADAEAHLAGCRSCRRYHEVFHRGRELLRSFPEIEVSDSFEARLRHRLFHLEDEEVLGTSASGSATTAATALGMALLLVMAAWAPVIWNEPEVALAPIVVDRPEPRPVRLHAPRVSILPAEAGYPLPVSQADLWKRSNTLLFQYSALNARRGQRPQGGVVLQQTGLD